MYVVLIIDHIHHLLNEFKKWKVSYIWDRREYVFAEFIQIGSKLHLSLL